MWIRLEDDFFHHPKVKPLAGPTCLFHIQKMCYCGMWLTDGRVPASEVRGKRQAGHADALVRSGLWHRAKHLPSACAECWKMLDGKPGDGWVIHDFLRYNPSKSEVEHKRAATREWRSQKGAQKRNVIGNVSPTNGTYDTNDTIATDKDLAASPDGQEPMTPEQLAANRHKVAEMAREAADKMAMPQ